LRLLCRHHRGLSGLKSLELHAKTKGLPGIERHEAAPESMSTTMVSLRMKAI